MKRIESVFLRGALSAALLALLAACGSHSGTAASPVQPQAVKGVATPSQISVVTAK
jgi:hypothetical protein